MLKLHTCVSRPGLQGKITILFLNHCSWINSNDSILMFCTYHLFLARVSRLSALSNKHLNTGHSGSYAEQGMNAWIATLILLTHSINQISIAPISPAKPRAGRSTFNGAIFWADNKPSWKHVTWEMPRVLCGFTITLVIQVTKGFKAELPSKHIESYYTVWHYCWLGFKRIYNTASL